MMIHLAKVAMNPVGGFNLQYPSEKYDIVRTKMPPMMKFPSVSGTIAFMFKTTKQWMVHTSQIYPIYLANVCSFKQSKRYLNIVVHTTFSDSYIYIYIYIRHIRHLS